MRTYTDEQIIEAISQSYPFTYLDDLKRRVAEKLGNPELATDRDFGYRVYCRNVEYREQKEAQEIAAMGYQLATQEFMKAHDGEKCFMLRTGGIISGMSEQEGKIKATGRGDYMFLPKGNRRNGYVPTYIKLATKESRA